MKTVIMWAILRKDDGTVWAVYRSRRVARNVSRTYVGANAVKVKRVFLVVLPK